MAMPRILNRYHSNLLHLFREFGTCKRDVFGQSVDIHNPVRNELANIFQMRAHGAIAARKQMIR
jgi:hypothetical protein